MEALLEEHEKLARKSNLSKSVDDVQKTIDLLAQARESIAVGTSCALLTTVSRSYIHADFLSPQTQTVQESPLQSFRLPSSNPSRLSIVT